MGRYFLMGSKTSDPANLNRAGGRISSDAWQPGFLTGASLKGFLNIFEGRIETGRLEIEFPDGTKKTIDSGAAGPEAQMQIKRGRTMRRLLFGGSVGLARAYIEGDWETPDLPTFIEFGARNRAALGEGLRASWWIRVLNRIRHHRRANTRPGSRRNIAFHYDLGNRFFRQWLDKSMTYSCAIFEPGDNSLEAAQLRKYRKLLDLLEVKPGERVLEIGCGWGGFAETAARERGARVTGITLSREQFDYARRRMAEAGLDDRVDIRFEDYRNISERFDHVVSIEMFEAVGEEYWPAYFETIHRCLRPGGRAALQIITIDDELFETYRKDVDFIQAYIFPGGMLPSMSELKKRVRAADLKWDGFKTYGAHYARTLAAWRERFDAAWSRPAFPDDFDEIFSRIWNYYLAYCEGGFRGGTINVMQLALAKP